MLQDPFYFLTTIYLCIIVEIWFVNILARVDDTILIVDNFKKLTSVLAQIQALYGAFFEVPQLAFAFLAFFFFRLSNQGMIEME